MLGKKSLLPKEMDVHYSMRISADLKNQIEAKAVSLGVKPAEVIRSALTEYVQKDVSITNEVLGFLSGIQKDVERLQRRFELHSNVFIFFLRFFFAFEGKELENIPKENRKQFFDKGERRRNDFIRLFKQQTSNKVNVFEMLLADCLGEEMENNFHEHATDRSDGLEIGD